ncbi:MAG: hypothetical protein ACUVUE_08025 [Candidatus Bathycorpusculaceae bacterium]
MQPNEKGDVERLFARSLGIIERIVFQLSFEDAQKTFSRAEVLVILCRKEV